MNRRTLLLGLLAAPLGQANAQIPVTDGASLLQQIKSWKQQVDQYTTQIAQLRNELNMYTNMVTNSVALPQSIWSSVSGDIQQVRSIANGASLLTGNAGGILGRLNSASGYANQAAYLPSNIGQQFTMWQQTLGNANQQFARTMGVQQGQEQNYTAMQAAIQAHSQTAVGQMQAIQAGNELAALTNTQLNQVQTTLVATAQAQQTHDIVAEDRLAAANAVKLRFLQGNPLPFTGAQY